MDLIENIPEGAQRHPWEVRRSAFFLGLLSALLEGKRDVDVLDCGAGDGWFASRLRPELPAVRSVTCWDAHYDEAALDRFASRYPDLVFTKRRPERRFDLMLALDVLEHVEDDLAFARDLAANALAPDGVLLVSVPAWQPLFGRHDTFLRHYRRYSPGACDAVLSSAGLRVVSRGGAFHSLVLPRSITVLRERLSQAMGRPLPPIAEPTSWTHGALVTSAVEGALAIDNTISRLAAAAKVNLPGLSYWAVCVRAS